MTQHSSPRRLTALLAGAAIAAAIGCGGDDDAGKTAETTPPTEAAPAPPAPAKEPRRPAGMEKMPPITRLTPEKDTDKIVLPEDFPADVPVSPDAKPTRYVSSRGGRAMTTLVVDETPESVRSYYEGALEREGWAVKLGGASDEMTMLSASKGQRTLAVAITVENGDTTITLIEGTK